jgi:hypothetical protein
MSNNELATTLAAMIDAATKKESRIEGLPDVEHHGDRIVLPTDPEHMSYAKARAILSDVEQAENQTFEFSEVIKGAPYDILVAVHAAMCNLWGYVSPKTKMTMFGPAHPDFMTVHTGPDPMDRIEVPYGRMAVPSTEMTFEVQPHPTGVHISGVGPAKLKATLTVLVREAESVLRKSSIYKGKAITWHVDNRGKLETMRQPDFLDTTGIDPDAVILNDLPRRQIETTLYGPLRNSDVCRKQNIPLRRGILLEGPYGTGKTLTARATAKVANDNGWTFMMLRRSQGLGAALEFARRYQPCVIFAEDIDRHADRSREEVNDLVNLLDGISSKKDEIIVVLTTNHVEEIDKALLRPGRFDAIISLGALDPEPREKLIRLYAGNQLAKKADLSEAVEALAGQSPATIREVVERSKLSAIVNGRDAIHNDDLVVEATTMQKHMQLLADKAPTPSHEEQIGRLFTQALGRDAMVEAVEKVFDIKAA